LVLSGCLHRQRANPDNCCCDRGCCEDAYGGFYFDGFHKTALSGASVAVKHKRRLSCRIFYPACVNLAAMVVWRMLSSTQPPRTHLGRRPSETFKMSRASVLQCRVYLGAREAMIVSKRASSRNGSHNGLSLRSP